MINPTKRFSVAIAFPRDGGDPLVLGISSKQSELLPLLDQVDAAEISVAGVIKDVQFTTKRTYPAPGSNPNPVVSQVPAESVEGSTAAPE